MEMPEDKCRVDVPDQYKLELDKVKGDRVFVTVCFKCRATLLSYEPVTKCHNEHPVTSGVVYIKGLSTQRAC